VTTILETRRLRLREFRPDDLDDLAEMVGDKEQMRFYPRPRTRDEARAWIDRNRTFYDEHGFGFWLVESRGGAAFLGYSGIRPFVHDGVSTTEIGWHTRKALWNRGIATEAAAGARDLAFSRFGRQQLVALVHPDHIASRRVAEKIGLREGATVLVEGDRYVTYLSSET
jgi:RimJ/RimL family protein N-acetyltransferase